MDNQPAKQMGDQVYIVPSWLPHAEEIPLLREVIDWQCLRKWSLSEVWRITTQSKKTWIAKWSRASQAKELAIYLELLQSLPIKQPALHSFVNTRQDGFYILEDLGSSTLEQQPQQEHFLQAAKTLAQIRLATTAHLQAHRDDLPQKYITSQQDYLDDIAFLLKHHLLTDIHKDMLLRLRPWLAIQLDFLYNHYPLVLCHNDYHTKNLVLSGSKIVPIDWANASITPHLGDLYGLIRDAVSLKIPAITLQAAFQAEMQSGSPDKQLLWSGPAPLEWQIALGGICWTLVSLRWICDEGVEMIAEASGWIPGLMQDIEKCRLICEK